MEVLNLDGVTANNVIQKANITKGKKFRVPILIIDVKLAS